MREIWQSCGHPRLQDLKGIAGRDLFSSSRSSSSHITLPSVFIKFPVHTITIAISQSSIMHKGTSGGNIFHPRRIRDQPGHDGASFFYEDGRGAEVSPAQNEVLGHLTNDFLSLYLCSDEVSSSESTTYGKSSSSWVLCWSRGFLILQCAAYILNRREPGETEVPPGQK